MGVAPASALSAAGAVVRASLGVAATSAAASAASAACSCRFLYCLWVPSQNRVLKLSYGEKDTFLYRSLELNKGAQWVGQAARNRSEAW